MQVPCSHACLKLNSSVQRQEFQRGEMKDKDTIQSLQSDYMLCVLGGELVRWTERMSVLPLLKGIGCG